MPENFWKFRNEGEKPELMLYGEISNTSWYDDELTPGIFANDLAALNGRDLDVHINSPGGDVFAAHAIYNQLKAYPGKVTMKIDGMCASAATVIACAGDKVIMPSNTIFMIHNPKSAMLGYFDKTQLEKLSEQLDAVKQTIVNVYRERVKNALTEDEIKAKMDSESWLTAEAAKAYGFVDEIVGEIPAGPTLEEGVLIVNSMSCKMDRFENAEGLKAILDRKEKGSDLLMNAAEKLKSIAGILGFVEGDAKPENEPKGEPDVKDSSADDASKAAVEAERARVNALDALKTGNPFVDSIVETGKKNGATAESLKPYIDALPEPEVQKPEASGQDKVIAAIIDVLRDNADSGAAKVAPSTPENKADEKQAAIDEIVALANKGR